MTIKRRDFIRASAGVGAATVASGMFMNLPAQAQEKPKSAIDALKSRMDKVVPISIDERKARIQKAQRLMAENKIGAIYLDGGTAMEYFTGMKWGNSERMMAAIIPAKGDVKYVGPHFEEERIRELILFGNDVRVWEEHESPYKLVAGIFADLGIRTGRIGFEERVRFFLFDGIRQAAAN